MENMNGLPGSLWELYGELRDSHFFSRIWNLKIQVRLEGMDAYCVSEWKGNLSWKLNERDFVCFSWKTWMDSSCRNPSVGVIRLFRENICVSEITWWVTVLSGHDSNSSFNWCRVKVSWRGQKGFKSIASFGAKRSRVWGQVVSHQWNGREMKAVKEAGSGSRTHGANLGFLQLPSSIVSLVNFSAHALWVRVLHKTCWSLDEWMDRWDYPAEMTRNQWKCNLLCKEYKWM